MKSLACVRIFLLCMGGLALTACQTAAIATNGQLQVNRTAVQQTLGARHTNSLTLPPSDSPPPSATMPATLSAPALTSTPVPAETRVLLASPLPTVLCDRAAAGYPTIDVTIDDNTLMQPSQAFTKIWRLTNAGACTWTRQYSIRFSHGDQMGAAASVTLPGEVPPGESIEIAVDMVAPSQAGTYRGNWKLTNAEGAWFGIGPKGDSPFWVQIIVIAPPTATTSSTPFPSATFTVTPTPSDTPTPTATPAVLTTGAVTLGLGGRLDLDNAQITPPAGEDLLYEMDANGFHLLKPQSNALLGVFGGVQPSLQDCLAAGMSAAPIAIESLSSGTYLCYQTTHGLPGWLRLVGVNVDDFSLSIEILTWAAAALTQ